MYRKIDKLLDKQVRPSLAGHGGNVELIDVENGIVFIKLTGGCQGCSSSSTTVKDGIEKLIKGKFSSITKVNDVTDHALGENPYM